MGRRKSEGEHGPSCGGCRELAYIRRIDEVGGALPAFLTEPDSETDDSGVPG